MEPPRSSYFVVVNGATPGQAVDLDQHEPPIRLGRGAECEVRLDDDEASRVHCQLTTENGQWRIQDLGSTNGTLVNSGYIEHASLSSGDLVSVGETLLLFTQDNRPSSPNLQPGVLADQTRVRRVAGSQPDHNPELPVSGAAIDGPVKKLAMLYRLSREIYQAKDLKSLIEDTLAAISKAIGVSDASICLRTRAGRLKRYSLGVTDKSLDSANLLSNWVMEKNEALLIDTHTENMTHSGQRSGGQCSGDTPQAIFDSPPRGTGDINKGNAIGVPIPGSSNCIGAIECFGPVNRTFFDVEDLNFLMAVGQHVGFATENIRHYDQVQSTNKQLRTRLKETKATLIGNSQPIVNLREQLKRVARSESTTLVLGQSGTGKEVTSQLIHELSRRAKGPFVTANCAALSESILESELFGHEKGAFTGADKRRKGRFEQADNGTIFLDEIGEMSASCQAKLLRLLEGQPFHRLGGTESIEVDVRIVAATHRNLEQMVQKGEFREDLWYRLSVIQLNMPSLSQRGDDILLLADYFLSKLRREIGHGPNRISREASAHLMAHPWPGNVRELRNAIERALVLATGDEIQPADFGLRCATQLPPSPAVSARPQPSQPVSLDSLESLEQDHIRRVLLHTHGNKSKACEILGITRASLYNKIKRFDKNNSVTNGTID